MHRSLRAALRFAGWLTLVCGLGLSGIGATAQTLSLSHDEAITLARRAYLSGDAVLAYEISSRIVAASPHDVEALLLLSASNQALGHPGDAFQLGRRAWVAARQAGRPAALRFEIAELTGHAALTSGHKRQAAFWLGRAVDLAPSDQVRQQTADDLQRIKAKIPLSFSASLRVSPTDNLNNGATTGLLTVQDTVIGGISGWSVAHAGVVTQGEINADYDLGVTPSGRSRNALGFGLAGTLHSLGPGEAAANPDLHGSDLDLWTATARWTQDRLLPGPAFEGHRPLRLTLEASQSWFAGTPYSPSLRAEVSLPLTKAQGKTELSLVGVVERQWQDAPNGIVDGRSLHLTGRTALDMPWGRGQLGYAIGGSLLRGDWSNATYDSYDANLSLDPGVHLGKISGSLGMGVSWRHYDDYSFGFVHATKGRTDQGFWLSASLGLGDLKLAGMTPTVTLMRQVTKSDISKYQTDATTLYLGLAVDF